MGLLSEDNLLKRADRQTKLLQKSVKAVLSESVGPNDTFDVFLSHSSAEPEALLLGLKGLLEDEGLSVYVDRYSDAQLSPARVTVETAATLRKRLQASRSLLYAYSRHSISSRWMPWELGFVDGMKRPLGVIPIVQSVQATFKGEEYLGLYPYIDQAASRNEASLRLWANDARQLNTYAPLREWVHGSPLKAHAG